MAKAAPTHSNEIINLKTWLTSMNLQHYFRPLRKRNYDDLLNFGAYDMISLDMTVNDVNVLIDGLKQLKHRELLLSSMVQAVRDVEPNMERILRDIRHICSTPMKPIASGDTKENNLVLLLLDTMEHVYANLHIYERDAQEHLSCVKCALDIFEIGEKNGMWGGNLQAVQLKQRFKRLQNELEGTFSQLTYRYSVHRTGHRFLKGEGRTFTEQQDYEKSMASLPKESRLNIYKGPQIQLPQRPDMTTDARSTAPSNIYLNQPQASTSHGAPRFRWMGNQAANDYYVQNRRSPASFTTPSSTQQAPVVNNDVAASCFDSVDLDSELDAEMAVWYNKMFEDDEK